MFEDTMVNDFELVEDNLFEISSEEEASVMDVMYLAFHCNP